MVGEIFLNRHTFKIKNNAKIKKTHSQKRPWIKSWEKTTFFHGSFVPALLLTVLQSSSGVRWVGEGGGVWGFPTPIEGATAGNLGSRFEEDWRPPQSTPSPPPGVSAPPRRPDSLQRLFQAPPPRATAESWRTGWSSQFRHASSALSRPSRGFLRCSGSPRCPVGISETPGAGIPGEVKREPLHCTWG